MNLVMVDGTVGKVDRRDNAVVVRICNTATYFNRKKNEWIEDSNWFSVTFFGRKGESVEAFVHPGQPIVVEAEMVTYPKTGPGAHIRLNGKAYHLLQKRESLDSVGSGEDFSHDIDNVEPQGGEF